MEKLIYANKMVTIVMMVTLVIVNESNTKIRLLELDTPEISKPECEAEKTLGLEARDYVNNLIENASTIEFKTDYKKIILGEFYLI